VSSTRLRGKRNNEVLYKKFLASKLAHLSPDERQMIEPVLQKYAHVFHVEDTNDIKSMDVIEHKIIVIRY